MPETIRVFIGFDPRQPVAYQVLAHSIWARCSVPVSITRLTLSHFAPFTRRGLTEFTYSRFLVPWLSEYRGVSVFLDSDILCLGDMAALVALCTHEPVLEPRPQHRTATNTERLSGPPAVWVVPHAGPRAFERASMMVFNSSRCKTLTPEWVQNAANNPFVLESWAEKVAPLPPEWNHLVGYDALNPAAKLVHYTMGIPCWPETRDCEFSTQWQAEAKATVSSVDYQTLMGKSVHNKHVQAGVLQGTT
jgi:hypothetical protein